MEGLSSTLYQEIILTHYRNPHRAGLRDTYDAEVQHHNPTCGDTTTLRVHLTGNTLADISYQTEGCAISQASSSMLAELLTGKSVPDAEKVLAELRRVLTSRGAEGGDEEVLEDASALAGVGRYPARVKCALLPWMAWQDATNQARGNQARENDATAAEEGEESR